MTTIDAKTQSVVDELPADLKKQIEEKIKPIIDEGVAEAREAFSATYQRIATNVKEMRDDLIDELDEEIEYSSDDLVQYINSAVNETLAIVSNELPLAAEDRPLTDFYFEIINT